MKKINIQNQNFFKTRNIKLIDKKGFSFIEMIVAISIFTIVIIALASSAIYFYRSNAYSVEQSFAVNSARKGIEFMVRDIREAIYSDEGAYPIVSASSNSFNFYSDVDKDNSVERVRYYFENGSLKKGIIKSSGNPPVYNSANEVVYIISENVRNIEQGVPIFRYYDNTGGEIFNPSINITIIAFIKVNLIVNINPSRLPNEFTLQSSATIRNLKTNL